MSQVFDEVPEDILDRVKYVKSVVNRLNANTSGVRFKADSETIQSIRYLSVCLMMHLFQLTIACTVV